MSSGEPPRTAALDTSERRAITVELAGIPGAGKSQLARLLSTELVARGHVVAQPTLSVSPSIALVRRLIRKGVATGTATLRRPVASSQVAIGIVRSHQARAADALGRFVQWQLAQHHLCDARQRQGVRILDEAVFQCLWSIGLRGDAQPVLAALSGSITWCPPDLLVVVRASPEVADSRLRARASRHSRTQRLATDARLAELRHGEQLLDHLLEWWSALGARGCGVVEFGPVESADGMLDQLLPRIEAAARRGTY